MGGSSKKVTVGYKYYLGMHMVLCHGPIDYLRRIEIDKRIAWEGSEIDTTITIDKEELFGGESREGGVSGAVDILGGGTSQVANTYLTTHLGSDIPAFRGVVSAILKHVYMGMNPYLKFWKFRAQRIHVRNDGETQWYDEKAEIAAGSPSISYRYVNLLATDFGSDHTDGITLSGFSASDILEIEKPSISQDSNLLNDAYSYWASDGATTPTVPPVIGQTWDNRFYVYAGGSIIGSVILSSTFYATEAQALTALQTYISSNQPQYTGHTSYTFYSTDPNPPDNRGSLSLRIKVHSFHKDMNPAHIIRECLTDDIWGMGYLDSDIDDSSFMASADTLYSEGMGISLLWDRQIPLEDFISEIVRHINATLYVDRVTGKFVLKLIRKDYDENTLLELDESNIKSVNDYVRTDPGETVNSVTVVYWDATKGTNAGITVDDPALIQAQGSVVNTTIQYPGFTNPGIAAKAAARDLRTLSSPLLSVTILANREAASLNIGDVFKFTYPDYHEGYVVMRVMQIALGDPRSNQVKIVASEDIFSIPQQPEITDEESGWEDIIQPPQPVVDQIAFEVPYIELVQIQSQTTVDEIIAANPQASYFAMAARRPSGNAINARLYTDPGTGYVEASLIDFCPAADLAEDIGYTDESFEIENIEEIENAEAGSWLQMGDELMKFVSLVGTTLFVKRGLFDTVPTKHIAGEVLYFWDAYADGDPTEYVESESIDGKLTTVSTGGELSLGSASAETVLMAARAYRPYPPGKVQINSSYFPETITGEISLTWAHRDRLQQTGSDYDDFTSNSIGPEASTTYNIRFYGEDDSLLREETGITTTSYTYTSADEISDSGGSATEDPNWADVELLMNFNGTDESQVFTDSSTAGRSFSVIGGAADPSLETDFKKFGSASLYIDGSTTKRIQTASDAVFNFGSSDFTVEAWVYVTASSGYGCICARWGGGDYGWFCGEVDNKLVFAWHTSNSFNQIVSSVQTITDGFHHMAWCKSSGTMRLFLDGVQVGSGSVGTIDSVSLPLVIGSDSDNNNAAVGYIDDLRITPGVARYTSAFTPPDQELGQYTYSGDARLNGRIRIELESERDSYASYTKHNHVVKRQGYGFNYGEAYGGTV